MDEAWGDGIGSAAETFRPRRPHHLTLGGPAGMLLAGIAGGTFIRTTGNHQSWLPILRTGRLRRFGKPILLRRKRRLPVAGIFRRNRRNCLLWLPVEHLRNFFEGIERRFREIDRRNAGRGFGNRFAGTAGGRPPVLLLGTHPIGDGATLSLGDNTSGDRVWRRARFPTGGFPGSGDSGPHCTGTERIRREAPEVGRVESSRAIGCVKRPCFPSTILPPRRFFRSLHCPMNRFVSRRPSSRLPGNESSDRFIHDANLKRQVCWDTAKIHFHPIVFDASGASHRKDPSAEGPR